MWERDWASLERGLLHDVFTRLTVDADAAGFHHVCRSWRTAAGTAGALVPGPWFVLRSTADGANGAFVRPVGRRRRVRRVRFDAAKGPVCASRGWLAVDDGGRLLLREPISRAEVPLPDFQGHPGYQLTDIFLSDDPLDAPGRWEAFAFFKMKHVTYAAHILAFCRPGDNEWARFDEFDLDGPHARFYWGLEFFRGRAYVLVGINCRIAVCDVDARALVPSSVALERMMLVGRWDAQVRLVECGGDLLVAAVSHYEDRMPPSCCASRRRRRPRTVGVRVMKVEFAAVGGGASMPVALSDVEGTGDYALFLAPRGHAFALPASGYPAVRPSCVYHFDTSIATKSASGMIITDLLDHTPHQHRPLGKLPLAGKWHPLSWFRPRRPSFDTTPARRRWFLP